MSEIMGSVKNYVLDNFLMGSDEERLDEDSSFLELGILDSTGVIELVSYIEEEFGIHVSDDEITPDNLDSLVNITKYIESKKA